MSRAELVRAAVSGLPPGKWEQRLLMVWQAYIDDSGNDPNQQMYVLAGFMAPYDKWISFSQAWAAELQQAPAVEYFKFTQAKALKGQFDDRTGWTEFSRNKRLLRLMKIIEEHAVFQISSGIQHNHFNNLVLQVPVPERKLASDKPYQLLFARLVASVAMIAKHVKIITEPVDCIFDLQQGYEGEAFELWRLLKAEPEIGPWIGDLNFRDEKQFLPLQAADLLAGCVRHYALHEKAWPFPAARRLLKIPGRGANWTGEEVRDFAKGMLLRSAEFADNNPDAPLFEYSPETARRDRKRARKNRRPAGG